MNPFFIMLLLATAAALIYWFKKATREQGIFALKIFLCGLAILLIVLTVTGRLPIFSLIPMLALGLFRRFALSHLLIPLIKTLAGSQHKQQPQSTSQTLSPQECLAILNLPENPSKEQIITAHRKLIKRVHPDHGGSDFQAKQVNLARDILLERAKNQ